MGSVAADLDPALGPDNTALDLVNLQRALAMNSSTWMFLHLSPSCSFDDALQAVAALRKALPEVRVFVFVLEEQRESRKCTKTTVANPIATLNED